MFSTVHEHQTLALVAPCQPYIFDIAIQNATEGVYVLQCTFYEGGRQRFQTSERIAWNENPKAKLLQIASIGEALEVKQVGLTSHLK